MKKKLFLSFIFSLLFFNFLSANFLENSFSVRASGMGGAFTGLADDSSAIFYNPAGLFANNFEFSTNSLDWERNKFSIADLTLLKIGNLAYANFNFNHRDDSKIKGQFYGFGSGKRGINWGMAYKEFRHRKGLDLGFLFNFTNEFSLGFNAQNISVIDLNLPFALRSGISYKPFEQKLMLNFDYLMIDNDSASSYLGAELKALEGLDLRIGFNKDNFSFGAGFAFLGGELNYAQTIIDKEESIHMLGFSIGNRANHGKRPMFISPKILVINLEGNITRGEDEFSLFGGISQGSYTLIEYLRKATKDEMIGGIILKINDFPSSLFETGTAQAIREEIMRFRAKDKFVIAYLESGAIGNAYYLATAADQIIMPQTSSIMGLGSRFQILRTYKLFKNLGIEWEIITRGRYKASLNSYQEQISQDGQEVIYALLKDVNEKKLKDIAEVRNIDLESLRKNADGSILTAKNALDAQLIDDIGYFDKVEETVKTITGLDKNQSLPIIDLEDWYQEIEEEFIFNVFNNIAIISIDGEISLGKNSKNFLFGGKISGADTISEQINQAFDNNTVKAIILRIDSPGGSAIASDLIYETIRKNKEKYKNKKIIAYMGSMAASGGYYISAACDHIIANHSTFTGSIGVIGMFPNFKGFFEKIGIEVEEYKIGKYMDIFSIANKLSQEERIMIEKVMQETYELFLEAVAKGRNLDLEDVKKLAQGRIYTGSQALDNGLVDSLGGFSDAIDKAKQIANIKGDTSLIYYNFDPESNRIFTNISKEAFKFLGIKNGLLPDIKAQENLLRIF